MVTESDRPGKGRLVVVVAAVVVLIVAAGAAVIMRMNAMDTQGEQGSQSSATPVTLDTVVPGQGASGTFLLSSLAMPTLVSAQHKQPPAGRSTLLEG